MEDYVSLLLQEILTRKVDHHYGELQTVFFGGGTPSLLPPPLLDRVLQALRECHRLTPDAEISMEMDPGTFDEEKLQGFLDLGVTRISLGVQSFQESALKDCGRSHSLADVHAAIGLLKEANVRNWSLDLISSLPSQSLDDWRFSLHEAVSAGPSHISIYDLQIEAGTAFSRRYTPGQGPLPSDEASAEMFREASRILRAAGYDHYEISNYALPGFQCKHNLVYWRNQPFWAFGLGAASYVAGRRLHRPTSFKGYADWVQSYVARGGEPEGPRETDEDRLLETVMLGLRLSEGLSLSTLAARFGQGAVDEILHAVASFVESGHVLVEDEQGHSSANGKEDGIVDGDSARRAQITCTSSHRMDIDQKRAPGKLRLSDPDGFLLSNEIIASIFGRIS